jgi:beta-lactamase regulating signal transducer with metallopeptidase domain
MSFVEWLAQPACRILTLMLVHFLWQGLVVVFVLIAFTRLCNIVRAQARYACSLVALVVMTACPIVTLTWISLGHERLSFPQRQQFGGSATSELGFAPRLGGAIASINAAQLETFQPYFLALWLSGVMFFGSRLVVGAIGVENLRRSRLDVPPALAARIDRLGNRLQMNAAGLVFLSNQVTEAMALGLVRKLVLIPAAWASSMPLDMLEAVIAHELAHLGRMDLWANFLQRIVETLFFYHPAVWWLSRRLRIERELCSDELAVTVTGERLVYAQTLAHLADVRRADVRPALAAFLRGEGNMRLLQRIRNVLAPSANEQRHWPAGLVALALAACLWTLSTTVLNTLSPAAYAAEEPAQEEINTDDVDEGGDDSQGDSAIELDVEVDANEIIEQQVAAAVTKALAAAEEIKKRELEKAARQVEEELKKVRLHHIQIEKDVRDKMLAARKEAQNKRAVAAEKLAKARVKADKDAKLWPANETLELRTERKRPRLDGDPEVTVEFQQDNDARFEELTALVEKLAAQVERLSQQVSELRDQHSNSEGRKP